MSVAFVLVGQTVIGVVGPVLVLVVWLVVAVVALVPVVLSPLSSSYVLLANLSYYTLAM